MLDCQFPLLTGACGGVEVGVVITEIADAFGGRRVGDASENDVLLDASVRVQVISGFACGAIGGARVLQTIWDFGQRVFDATAVGSDEVPGRALGTFVEIVEAFAIGDRDLADIIGSQHEPVVDVSILQIVRKKGLGQDIVGVRVEEVFVIVQSVPGHAIVTRKFTSVKNAVWKQRIGVTRSFRRRDFPGFTSRALRIGAVPLAMLDEVTRSCASLVFGVHVVLDVAMTARRGPRVINAILDGRGDCHTLAGLRI